MEHVLRVIFVLERGQFRKLLRRIGATYSFGALVAEGIDILSSGERIECRRRTPRERLASLVLRGVRPSAPGDVFERGVSEGERGLLVWHLGDRAAVRLQADVRETSGRRLPPALQHRLDRTVG